jgi:hypothetical protein
VLNEISATDFARAVVFRLPMKTSRTLPALLSALVTLPIFALAEEPKPATIATLRFENATLGEVVNSLRKLSGANIILAPTLRDTKAPDIDLSNVTPGGVMQALTNAMPEIAVRGSVDESGAVYWSLTPRAEADKAKPEPRIVRIFKASTKEKLAGPKLDELLKNISEAAREFCQLNVRGQGRPETQSPTIEAHAGTGLLAVAGTEAEVQVVGQVIQALGGEVVPFTGIVAPVTTTSPLSSSAQATSPEAGNLFVTAYLAVQAGEKAEQEGDGAQAIKKYESAVVMLTQIATTWPAWQTQIVDYRKKRTVEALSRVRDGRLLPAKIAATPVPPAGDSMVSALEGLMARLEDTYKQIEKSHEILEKSHEQSERTRQLLERAREVTETARKRLAEAEKKNDALKADREALQKVQEALKAETLAPQQRGEMQKQADELKKRLEAVAPPQAK